MDPSASVSVVIPTWNRAPALRRCLEALLGQTAREFEIIVVDDGSTDGTPQVVGELGGRDGAPPISLISNRVNRGANASRNRGVRAARGDLVAFLDSDCVPRPSWLEELRRAFDSERVAAVCGRVVSPEPENVYELALSDDALIAGAGGPAPRLVSGNLAVRRSILERFPFDEDLRWGCDEEGLYLRLRAAGLEQRLAPAAVVVHEHPFDRRSFFAYARRTGAAAAWLVYKYRLAPRLDVAPFALALCTLPLGLLGAAWLLVPAALTAAGAAGLLYLLVTRKQRSLRQALTALPVYTLYYFVRSAAYLIHTLRLHLRPSDIRRVRLSRTR